MARAGNDKGIKEWFDQNVLAKLSDAERELISQTKYDLYYGPGGELEDDEDYPGFSAAVKLISDALEDYRTDLWLDPDSGFISDAEPEGYYSDPDPDYDDEDAEAVWNEPEDSVQYDWSDVKRIGLGSELAQYVNPGRKPNPPKGAYPEPDAWLWDAPANRGRVLTYTHVGQHSEADLGYYSETLPAKSTDPAVRSLKKELEDQVGYVLHVVQRRPTTKVPASADPESYTRVTFRYPKQSTLDRAWGKSKKKNPLTDEQIAELLAEAIEVGDVEMVEACELAIDGDGEAIMACIQAISYSEREGNPKKKAGKKKAGKKAGKKKAGKKKAGKKLSTRAPKGMKRAWLVYGENSGVNLGSVRIFEGTGIGHLDALDLAEDWISSEEYVAVVQIFVPKEEDAGGWTVWGDYVRTTKGSPATFLDGESERGFGDDGEDIVLSYDFKSDGGPLPFLEKLPKQLKKQGIKPTRRELTDIEEDRRDTRSGNPSKAKRSNPGTSDVSTRAKRMMNPQNY